MEIENGWWGDEGHDVNVHILGSGSAATVIKDSWFQPLIWLGLGFLGVVLVVSDIVDRLRPNNTSKRQDATLAEREQRVVDVAAAFGRQVRPAESGHKS